MISASTVPPTSARGGSIVSRRFPFPVVAGVELRANGPRLPDPPATIRDHESEFVSRAADAAFREFPRARYPLELHGAVPCVLAFEIGFTIVPDGRGIGFDDETTVRLGTRSARPASSATVTTTDEPRDLMAAISTFGSAVATRSPERPLPLFQGHPPALERGEELRIPDRIDTPNAGVTVQLQPERAYAYAAAPLATYIAAVELASVAEFGEEGFRVVGDGASTLADTDSRPPAALVAETLADGYTVRYRGYATDTAGPGSRVRSPLDGDWSLTTAGGTRKRSTRRRSTRCWRRRTIRSSSTASSSTSSAGVCCGLSPKRSDACSPGANRATPHAAAYPRAVAVVSPRQRSERRATGRK